MFGQYFGQRYFGDPYFGPSGGAAPSPTVADEPARRRGGPPPGSYRDRSYLPPGQWIKKPDEPTIEEVRELYAEAKREIPLELQQGLLPVAFRKRGKSDRALPPASNVDFESLAKNLSVLQALWSALARVIAEREAQAAEHKRLAEIARQERIREEEILILLFLQM